MPKKLNFRLLIINFLPPTLSLDLPNSPLFFLHSSLEGSKNWAEEKESLSSFLGGEVGLRGEKGGGRKVWCLPLDGGGDFSLPPCLGKGRDVSF